MEELIKNRWVNMLWDGCLDKPRTIGDVTYGWGYSSSTVFLRNREIIKRATKEGLFTIVGEVPKKRGTIELYRSELSPTGYYKILKAFEGIKSESKNEYDYKRNYNTYKHMGVLNEINIWLRFLNDEEIRPLLFSFDKIRLAFFEKKDIAEKIASKYGLQFPILSGLTFLSMYILDKTIPKLNIFEQDLDKGFGAFLTTPGGSAPLNLLGYFTSFTDEERKRIFQNLNRSKLLETTAAKNYEKTYKEIKRSLSTAFSK